MKYAVIPCFNESRTIGSLVIETLSYVDQVLVVDDGSSDQTAFIAERAGAEVLRFDENRGKGVALRQGLRRAVDAGAEIVITLDGDGQHAPRSIPALLEPIEKDGVEVVVGARNNSGDGSASVIRSLGRRILDTATNTQMTSTVSDTQSGFRAFSSTAIQELQGIDSGMGVESEMLIQADRSGLQIKEVDVEEHYNSEATSTVHPIRHGRQVLWSILRVIRFQRPLLFFGTISLVLLGAGGIFGLDTATHYYATREFWPGKALLSLLCTVVGVQLGTAGILLDYLNKRLRSSELAGRSDTHRRIF